MVVWSDTIDNIVSRCREFQKKLTRLVWKHRAEIGSSSILISATTSVAPSTTASNVNLVSTAGVIQEEAAVSDAAAGGVPWGGTTGSGSVTVVAGGCAVNGEEGAPVERGLGKPPGDCPGVRV